MFKIKILNTTLNTYMTTPKEIRKDRSENPWIFRFAGILMSFAIMASSWFLNQAWTKITAIECSLHTLEVTVASGTVNKFTQTDWASTKTTLDNERLLLDRRVMRLEETNRSAA